MLKATIKKYIYMQITSASLFNHDGRKEKEKKEGSLFAMIKG